MNGQPFDFEKETPPKITAASLQKEISRRKLIRQIRLLKLAALILACCVLAFAAVIVRDSLLLCAVAVAFVCVSLSGYIILSALFYRTGHNEKNNTSIHFKEV